jgi:hypothetical protein
MKTTILIRAGSARVLPPRSFFQSPLQSRPCSQKRDHWCLFALTGVFPWSFRSPSSTSLSSHPSPKPLSGPSLMPWQFLARCRPRPRLGLRLVLPRSPSRRERSEIGPRRLHFQTAANPTAPVPVFAPRFSAGDFFEHSQSSDHHDSGICPFLEPVVTAIPSRLPPRAHRLALLSAAFPLCQKTRLLLRLFRSQRSRFFPRSTFLHFSPTNSSAIVGR